MSELLFEVGSEEIPSGYIRPAVEALGKSLREKLDEWGAGYEDIRTYATPRRLTVCATGLPVRRPVKTARVYGPPASAAFDESGKPTKAAAGFARGKGADVSALKVGETDKGKYVYVETEEGGEMMTDLLAEALPAIALALPFPKSMTWGDGATRFTRPIHWIVAIFDGETIAARIGETTAGSTTRGHRFMGSGEITVAGREDYLAKLKENFVIADIEERKRVVTEGARAAAAEMGAVLYEDDDLAETVAFLTEWPVALRGSFDEEFLELPDELLIASMKGHQKMFAVKDENGRLTNGFIGVSNTKTVDDSVVSAGYRRVLRARLSDAKFFFDEDRKRPLDSFMEKLDDVIYHKKLGTIGEKVGRITALAGHIAGQIEAADKKLVERAARLCKADLETLMVYEFPELQGVMGREYARLAGEPEEVCAAIYEHYLPRWAGDELPKTHTGAIVGLADRMDTIAGCFGVGLEPTGAQDPFALRRHTLGVIQIVFARGYTLSLSGLIRFAIDQLREKMDTPPEQTEARMLRFFEGRLKNLWISRGVPHDVADAALAVGFDDLADANLRATAMAELKKREFFEPLAITFKRVANITKGHEAGEVDPSLFEADAERDLYGAIVEISREVEPKIASKKFLDALETIATLREKVDRFFDDVLVMTEDEALRRNRLSLLSGLSSMFLKIADFSRIVA